MHSTNFDIKDMLTVLFSKRLTICLKRAAKAQLIRIINKSVKFQANVVKILQT